MPAAVSGSECFTMQYCHIAIQRFLYFLQFLHFLHLCQSILHTSVSITILIFCILMITFSLYSDYLQTKYFACIFKQNSTTVTTNNRVTIILFLVGRALDPSSGKIVGPQAVSDYSSTKYDRAVGEASQSVVVYWLQLDQFFVEHYLELIY